PSPFDASLSSTGRRRFIGRLLVVGAAVLWSSSGLFAKASFFDAFPQFERGLLFAFWRASAAAFILAPAARRPRWRPGLIPLALCFAGMNATYLLAMTQSTAANAIWLQNTAPFWVLLFGMFILGERVTRHDLVPFAFAMVGIGIILGFELTRTDAASQLGVVFGLLSGILYAGVVTCLRHLRDENSAWLIALNHATAAVLLLPVVIAMGLWPTLPQLAWLMAFGTFQMAIPYVLLSQGLKRIPSQEAILIGLLEPLLVPAWALLFWGERAAWWTAAGAAFILAGLVLRYALLPRLFPDETIPPNRIGMDETPTQSPRTNAKRSP
ncbi:MAG: DMT family transporter, partial [Planctomycetota bacterium]